MTKQIVMLVSLAVSLAAATDYSGIWSGKGGVPDPKYGSVPHTAEMTLLQAGSSVSGTLKIDNGKIMPIAAGTISGTTITFALQNGSGTGTLTQSGAQLKGRLTSSRGEVLQVVFSKK